MSKLDTFLQLAEQKVGTSGDWSWSKCYSGKNTPWSATFISACAKELNLTKIIPITSKAQDIADKGISSIQKPGQWIPGTKERGIQKPQAGDIVLFSWNSDTNTRADSVGIVKEYDKNNKKMIVISGDSRKAGESRSEVGMSTISLESTFIKGYFRPDWESED